MKCVTALARLSILRFYPLRRITQGMGRPGPKPKKLDPIQFAAAVLEAVTGEAVGPPPKEETGPAKDPHAVALGRKGGLKGGPARAKKLGKKKLKEAAKKAAARWKKD
jgi:hypothetical protein